MDHIGSPVTIYFTEAKCVLLYGAQMCAPVWGPNVPPYGAQMCPHMGPKFAPIWAKMCAPISASNNIPHSGLQCYASESDTKRMSPLSGPNNITPFSGPKNMPALVGPNNMPLLSSPKNNTPFLGPKIMPALVGPNNMPLLADADTSASVGRVMMDPAGDADDMVSVNKQ